MTDGVEPGAEVESVVGVIELRYRCAACGGEHTVVLILGDEVAIGAIRRVREHLGADPFGVTASRVVACILHVQVDKEQPVSLRQAAQHVPRPLHFAIKGAQLTRRVARRDSPCATYDNVTTVSIRAECRRGRPAHG